MKNFVLSSVVLLLFIGRFNQNAAAQQTEIPNIKTGNYLTIGSFEIRQNATDFKNQVNAQGLYNAQIGYLSSTNLNYVYIKTYDNPKHGYPDIRKVRGLSEYNDTWVFSVKNNLPRIGLEPLGISGDYKYYLTIGTFKHKQNAINFLSYVQQKNEYDVHITYSPYTEYFYVYVQTFLSYNIGHPNVSRLRSQTEFDDTWLFSFREDELIPEGLIVVNKRQHQQLPKKDDVVISETEITESLPTTSVIETESIIEQQKDLNFAQKLKELRETDGLSDEQIIAQHKDKDTESVKLNVQLSYLNSEGLTLKRLSDDKNTEIPTKRLIAVGGMVGQAIKDYPILTSAHEDEMFTFLTEEVGQYIFDEADFIRLVETAINMKDFNRQLPLDLARAIVSGNFKLTDPQADSLMHVNAERINVKIIPLTYVDQEGNYQVFFDTYYAKTRKEVSGSIEIIDPVRLKQISVKESNILVKVPDPKNQSQAIQVIANIFGYKKVQHDFKMSEPFDALNAQFLNFKGDVLLVDFPLSRYETGDIATMFNVYFFKDAAVMKPESRYELKALLEMLQENVDLKIRIHGHTNGNSPGKIIQFEEGATDFFSLAEATEEGFGSSKELSAQRAQVIKDYLVTNGVDPGRAEVKGWGGKKPIYDKFDRRALKNVRVEIEILED